LQETTAGFLPPVRTAPASPTDLDHLPVREFQGHARAFLKVQDGCDIGCSFCIVPRLRRKPRDKPIELVVEEARTLASNGHRELVVSGVSVGLYGKEDGGPNLAEVLRRIIALPDVERIRLSSLHPREVTEELLEAWASSPKMMPHVHLPLQAGSNRVLEAMRRNYSAEEFLAAVERARAALDDPAFNTDVIVGFPGETAEDFEETRRVSREAEFSRMHIFPYSVRPHTTAARLPDRVSSTEAKARARQLKEDAASLALAYARRFEGQTASVLAENFDPDTGRYDGYTERYIPVSFTGPPGLRGDVVKVRLTRAGTDRTEARIEREDTEGTKVEVPGKLS
jgi:threonylcarbamoyladenosine tRNA methylthiotransferase MtaB